MRSPFTGLRFARLELDNFRAGTMIKLALCAIALIPLIYAGLFLLAFLDPYGSLVNVPAAVVNQDSGDKIDGERRNIGQELCDELVKNNENRKEGEASGYNWKFVDEDTARRGLDDGTYYMELVIPENFSSAIASADSKDPENAELRAYFNPSTNLIAQTVGSSMVTKIRAELNYKVGREYYKNIFVKIEEAGDQLQEGVDGSKRLESGLGTLEDGSDTLTDGLQSAKDGSDSLESGLGKLESGSGTLTKGIESAKDGSDQLASGSKKLQAGSKKLGSGLESAKSGAKRLEKGAKSARSGSGTITENLEKLESGSKSAGTGADTVYESMDALVSGLESAQSGIALMVDGDGTSANPGISGIAKQLGSASGGASTLTAQVTRLGTDATVASTALKSVYASMEEAEKSPDEQVSAMAKQVIAQLDATTQTGKSAKESADAVAGDLAAIQQTSESLSAQMEQLDAAVSGLELYAANLDAIANGGTVTDASGAKTETGGISSAVTGAKQLKAGVKELKDGIDQLSSGAAQLKAGSQTLTQGLGTLADGEKSLVVGLGQASTGNATITSSLGTAATGAQRLSSGLASAASGSGTVTKGLGTAKDGAGSLSSGLSSAASGSGKISSGLSTAKSGTEKLHDGLKDGKKQLEDNVQNRKAKAKMMSQPVTANGDSKTGQSITQVKNYGTGFAPYFISLGMWVGALMISMVMNVLNRRILMSGASSISAVLASYFPMVLVSFAQVVLLLLVIQFGLGMEVKYPLAFYLFGLLTSVCFIAIVQFFRASMGTTGMVVVVILLMLQLCTAAGTFPIEAELPVFNALNPFLPMTYVVHGFRMCMAGLSLAYLGRDVAVLLLFSVAFLFFTFLWARHRRTVTMSMLYPPLKLSD